MGDSADPATAPTATATPTFDSGTYGAPQSDDDKNYILFVHGWRMTPDQRRAFGNTAYKRLFWSGYKGRFGMFSWPTEYIDVDASDSLPWNQAKRLRVALNYRDSEGKAFQSAAGLRSLMASLNDTYPGHVDVMSHSMGGFVVGEALRQESLLPDSQRIANIYVASQSSANAEMYDMSAPSHPGQEARMGKENLGFTTATALPTPNYYASDPATNQPNFNGIHAAVNEIDNFYNPDDPVLKQATRIEWGKDLPVSVGGVADSGYRFDVPTGTFYAGNNALTWASDRYTILSQIDQARSDPLGSQAVATRGDGAQVIDKNVEVDLGGGFYDHSGQFRSDYMHRHGYWETLLDELGLRT